MTRPTAESAVAHKRKGTLRSRLQRAQAASRERVGCPELSCRKTFGPYSYLRRHCIEVHGKDSATIRNDGLLTVVTENKTKKDRLS